MQQQMNGQQNNYFWWEADKEDLAQAVVKTVNWLEDRQGMRSEANRRYLRMYGNYDVLGLRSSAIFGLNEYDRIALNVIKSGIDTLASKVAKNKPRARFLTTNGDYTMQQKGMKLERYIAGEYHKNDVYKKGRMAFTDGGIFGTGCIHVYSEKGKIKCEKVFIEEIKIDEDEAAFGSFKQLHRTKFVNRYDLMKKYPKYKVDIQSVQPDYSSWMVDTSMGDMIKVVESWRLPSAEGAKDGRHTLVIENKALMDVPYDCDYFPFEFFKYNERPIGFFGQGVAEILTGTQVEINRVLRTIQTSIHLGAVPKMFVENGSKVVFDHLNNEIGGIIRYTGTRPTYDQLMRVPPDLWQHLLQLYNWAYEQIGVNQLSVSGQKPAGLNSGKAVREYNDIETERQAILAQDYEEFHIRLWRLWIRTAKYTAKQNPEYAVTLLDKKGFEKIKWSEIDMDEDAYILQSYPSSLLSNTPSGRLDDVQTLMDMEMVDKETAGDLLDYPDVERYFQVANAPRRYIMKIIEMMVDKGEYNPPSVLDANEHNVNIMNAHYFYYKNLNLPPENLELFTRWISDANAILSEQMEPPMTDNEMMDAQSINNDQAMLQQQAMDDATQEQLIAQQMANQGLAV